MLAGGLLLLLICWQMLKDLLSNAGGARHAGAAPKRRTLTGVLIQIFIADISTSLDNVLAVAGAVRDQPPWVLFAGLGLSVVMTGFAATWIARFLHRMPWLGYLGLGIVLLVSGRMIWDGVEQLGWLKMIHA